MCENLLSLHVLRCDDVMTCVRAAHASPCHVRCSCVTVAHLASLRVALQNAFPNAYTLAIAGKRPFVMLNTALIELLTEKELQCVIAHELGHLKCDHGVWLTIGNVLASGTINFLPVVSSAVEEALFKWMRAAELTCDRCVAKHCLGVPSADDVHAIC